MSIHYSNLSHHLQGKAFDLLMEKFQPKDCKYILDLGCGTGNNAFKLLNHIGENGKVLGIDPHQERIIVARESFGQYQQLKFEQGYAKDVKNFGTNFDLAVTSTVLNWIPTREKIETFKSIHDCLSLNGEYIFNSVHVERKDQGFFGILNPQDRQKLHNIISHLRNVSYMNIYERLVSLKSS